MCSCGSGQETTLTADAKVRSRGTDFMRPHLVSMVCVVSIVLCNVAIAQTVPIIVVDTEKGTFEIETYPIDAPRTVAHIVDLVKRGFYDGQRVHRALPGFVV